jgi:hypothetical protein
MRHSVEVETSPRRLDCDRLDRHGLRSPHYRALLPRGHRFSNVLHQQALVRIDGLNGRRSNFLTYLFIGTYKS